MAEELWRAIPGVDSDYEVSSLGRVRSWKRHNGTAVPRILTPFPNERGYLRFAVSLLGGRQRTIPVHKAVAAAFHGECPGGQEVRHLDDDKLNDSAVNLRYGTRMENVMDRVRRRRGQEGDTGDG